MKKVFALMILCFPMLVLAQQEVSQGIKWTEQLTWDQIKEKARRERKFIFVDCYTTWCLPCKKMEQEVYSKATVSRLINDLFVPVKFQMDTTRTDDNEVIKRYYDSRFIRLNYKIDAYPTILFFNPYGEIVHKGVGAVNDSSFLILASNALDSTKQYYTLIRKYNRGEKNYKDLPYLAKTALFFKDDDLAMRISQDYLKAYLYKATDSVLFTKQNLEFIFTFLQSSREKGFKIFYENPNLVDNILQKKGLAQWKVEEIISKEEISSTLVRHNSSIKEPRWMPIEKKIGRKYSKEIAERLVLNARLVWYNENKDWRKLATYTIAKLEKYGFDTSNLGKTFLNNTIYEVVFSYSNDTSELAKGLKWMKIIISAKEEPEYIDTYANLLYKCGNKEQAIYWEKKAIDIEQKQAVKSNRVPDPLYLQTLNKMLLGKPTWPTD
jgi:thioredoxin-related protein